MILPDNKEDSNVFCYVVVTDKQQETLYTDTTEALPARLMNANQYLCVAYDYDNNYIFTESIPDVKDNTIIAVSNKSSQSLLKKSHRPLLS